VLLEKELFPWLPAWVDELLLPSAPFVLDIDDAIFHNYDEHESWWVRRTLGRKIDGLMARAAVVCAGNEYLADRARRAGAGEIALIPSAVDLNRYTVGEIHRRKRPIVGWIGTPVTQGYLKLIAPALRDAVEQFNARIVLVGANEEPKRWFPCEIRGWRESNEADDILDFDVGVMPLPEAPWERGKCGYKLIQYMACARPVVASPVGVNERLVINGINGYLATGEASWLRALGELLMDADARAAMGRRGRQIVENGYCTAVTGPRYARVIRDLKA